MKGKGHFGLTIPLSYNFYYSFVTLKDILSFFIIQNYRIVI